MTTQITNRNTPFLLAALIALAPLVAGCATHKFVRTQADAAREELGQQIAEMDDQVAQISGQVDRLGATVDAQGEEIAIVSDTARDALERARAAGKLAEGKFLYEVVLSDDAIRFGFEDATLTAEAREVLDEFAEAIKARNENVYLEIQGHTDASGDESYNLLLGEERAESVHRYLSLEHGFPLHRTATISYGESAPIADNATREGRAQNRRVSIVVLR